MKYLLIIVLLAGSQPVFSQDKPVACSSSEHSQFDFWLGEWSVSTPDGKPAGVNSISKIEDGCAIRENWASASPGYTGTSYNFYNQREKHWEQLWLDNQGGFLKLSGKRKGRQMILQSAPVDNKQGVKVIQRITWTANEDGSVRQLWEVVAEGKENQVAFDGLYVSKANGD
ncbi:MAG: hypothetical protein KJP04_05135 [Arenicella sp.]|nr:hypothetical protein [Arenicella sp.]